MAASQYLSIGDQVALTVHHVTNHHDGVNSRIGEFERQFGGLDIVGKHHRVRRVDYIWSFCENWIVLTLTNY